MNIKQYSKNKIIILTLAVISILGLSFCDKANAESPSIYISPTNLNKTVGDIFDISVKVNPDGQKVCVVEGKLVLNKLSCQKITMGSGVSAQISPSCDDLDFLLGIQGCTMSDKTIFTVTVKAESVGSSVASFTGVDIIGEGSSLSSSSLEGIYNITSFCSCGDWSIWQDGTCGGRCSLTQRLQTRTRICTPFGCENQSEIQCRNDLGCIPLAPIIEDKEEVEEVVVAAAEEEEEEEMEEVIGQSTEEKVKESQKKETITPKKVAFSEEKIAQKSLLASLAMVVGEISKSFLFTIVTILCLASLITIGAREWLLFRKKRND